MRRNPVESATSCNRTLYERMKISTPMGDGFALLISENPVIDGDSSKMCLLILLAQLQALSISAGMGDYEFQVNGVCENCGNEIGGSAKLVKVEEVELTEGNLREIDNSLGGKFGKLANANRGTQLRLQQLKSFIKNPKKMINRKKRWRDLD